MNPFDSLSDRFVLLIIGGVFFLAALALGLVVFAPLIDYTRHRRRVAQVQHFSLPGTAPAPAPAATGTGLAGAALAMSAKLLGPAAVGATAERLDRAGMRLRPNEWVLWRILACIVGIGLC